MKSQAENATKCMAEKPASGCKGPYAKSSVFVCYDCAVYHDEHHNTACECDDCHLSTDTDIDGGIQTDKTGIFWWWE